MKSSPVKQLMGGAHHVAKLQEDIHVWGKMQTNEHKQSLAAQQNQVQHVFNSFKHTQALLKSKWLEKCNICKHQGKILQLTVKSFGHLKPGSALLPIRVGPATALQLLQLKHQQHLRAEQTPFPINLVPYIILIYQQISTALFFCRRAATCPESKCTVCWV